MKLLVLAIALTFVISLEDQNLKVENPDGNAYLMESEDLLRPLGNEEVTVVDSTGATGAHESTVRTPSQMQVYPEHVIF